MSEKKIHIVFQVLNFLRSNESKKYNLSDLEKLLLIQFAAHRGKKGICPSISLLSKELHTLERNVYKLISKLKSKGLIDIQSSPGKANIYLFTTPVSTDRGNPIIPLSAGTGVPLSPGTGDPCPQGQGLSILLTKELTNLNNRESARRKRAPLSADFILNKEGVEKGKEVSEKVGLSLDDLFTKFKNLAKTKDKVSCDWHTEWLNFLINERPQGFLPAKAAPEIKSNVKWFEVPEWQKTQPKKVEDTTPLPTPAEGLKKMREARLKQNGQHGGLPNGHPGGHHGRGSGSS